MCACLNVNYADPVMSTVDSPRMHARFSAETDCMKGLQTNTVSGMRLHLNYSMLMVVLPYVMITLKPIDPG